MTLHLIFSATTLDAARQQAGEDDGFLLLADGVYAQSQAPAERTAVLSEDLRARGVPAADAIRLIDYAEFVALCIEHQPIVSWND